jgi:hypothetical protein
MGAAPDAAIADDLDPAADRLDDLGGPLELARPPDERRVRRGRVAEAALVLVAPAG